MGEYDPKNLQSTLNYIKTCYGTDCFMSGRYIAAYLSDLAPTLKSETKMIRKLSDLQIIDEFIEASSKDEFFKRRVFAKAMSTLVESEFIRDDIAKSYLTIVASVFSWDTIIDIPKANNSEPSIELKTQSSPSSLNSLESQGTMQKTGVSTKQQIRVSAEQQTVINEAIDQKKDDVKELSEKIANSNAVVVVEYRGMTVAEIIDLKKALREESIEMKMYKNTIAQRAAKELGYDALEDSLVGPNALVFGADQVATARVLAKFAQDHDKLILRKGIIDGAVVDAAAIRALASLPSKEGMLVRFTTSIKALAEVKGGIANEKTGNTTVTLTDGGKSKDVREISDLGLVNTYLENVNLLNRRPFDNSRYEEESTSIDFLEGQQYFWNGYKGKAKDSLEKAYSSGNKLAGVLLGQLLLNQEDPSTKAKGINMFLEAANAGNPLGAAWISEAYRTGNGFPKDIQMSDKLFQTVRPNLEMMAACGSADAQYFLGFNLLHGIGCDRDPNSAFFLLNNSMQAGNPSAACQVAIMYRDGIGRDANEQRYFEILNQFAETQNKSVNYQLGLACYLGRGTDENDSRAAAYFLKAAQAGHKIAQYYLGSMYSRGDSFEKDSTKAFEWYAKSADQGYAPAQYKIGLMCSNGIGTEQNKHKAIEYFLKSAEQGNKQAQYELFAELLSDNKPEKAFSWLQKSAENGYVKAETILARMYGSNDYGFETDDNKFVYWISKAADSGDTEAQRILGEAYIYLDNPAALPYDIYKSEELLHSAARKGDIQATLSLCELYMEHPDLGGSEQQIKSYLSLTEQILDQLVSDGNKPGREYFKLAKIYDDDDYALSSKISAMIYYWKAFQNDYNKEEAIYKVGYYHFMKNMCSDSLPGDDILLKEMETQDKGSNNKDLEYIIGCVYLNGFNNIKSDPSLAEFWLSDSYKHGNLTAQCTLALSFIENTERKEEGFKLAEDAYNRGSIEGARLLGICYRNGYGIKKSRSKAKALIKEAADKGNEAAKKNLKEMSFFSKR